MENNLKNCQNFFLKEINDDQINCNILESFIPLLSHLSLLSEQIISLIFPVLKKILKFWNDENKDRKGEVMGGREGGRDSRGGKWSSSCLNLTIILISLLVESEERREREGGGGEEEKENYIQYYKIIGFVLGKSLNMGTVSEFFSINFSLFISL